MSVYFTSDPHLGHKNIHRFRSYIKSSEENTELFVKHYEKTVRKQDIVYFLGDVAFDEESLDLLSQLKGRKIIIKGNHDDIIETKLQAEVFEEIYGMLKYKEFWLSHCPIHPAEMRKAKGNIHGHVHNHSINDPRYLNVCTDNLMKMKGTSLISLDDVRAHFAKEKKVVSRARRAVRSILKL